MRRRAGLALALIVIAACAPRTSSPTSMTPSSPPLIASSRQMVVVTTPSWGDTRGSLVRYSRASVGDAWTIEHAAVPIVVGRTGLAWGVGFDALDDAAHPGPHKHEGDGKSPAGVFPLDTVFGYAPASAAPTHRMPYVQLTNVSDCVDDTASAHYNTVVEKSAVPAMDWNSAEHMRSVWQYEIGVIVGYNAAPPVPGRGSCIFLHIWAGPASTTAGCTALDVRELTALVEWLDANRRPMLVQLTASEYQRLRGRWELPEVAMP